MDSKLKKTILKVGELNELTGGRQKSATINVFAQKLQRFSWEEISTGLEKAIDKEVIFPSFGKIKSYIDEDMLVESDELAYRQAQYVKLSIETGNKPDFDDPITSKIMSLYMPYADWKNREPEDLAKFFIPQFAKKYREISSSIAQKSKLPKRKALGSGSSSGIQKRNTNIPSDESEREEVRAQNVNWLESQEKANLGGFKLLRHGDAGCYSQSSSLGIPKGDIFLFADKDFQRNIKGCPYFQERYPSWDFTCSKSQSLDGDGVSGDKIGAIISKIRENLASSSGVKNKSNSLLAEKFKSHQIKDMEVLAK